MIGSYKNIPINKWLLTFFFLLFFSFNFNIFGLGPYPSWLFDFQKDSSAIVEKTVECKGVVDDYSGPIMPKEATKYSEVMFRSGCSDEDFIPYGSQFGLQARVMSLSVETGAMTYKVILKATEVVLAAVFAIVLVFLVKKTRDEFGNIPGITMAMGILLSPWIASFSYNLYWFMFTLFLPFVFSFYCYKNAKKSNRLLLFYIILFLLFLVKFLNGYEYASTMVFSVFVAVAYHELSLVNTREILSLWRKALSVLAVGIAAILMAISFNVYALKDYAGGLKPALEIVKGRAGDRSDARHYQDAVVPALKSNTPAIYSLIDNHFDIDRYETGKGNPLVYLVLSLATYSMLPAYNIPIIMPEPFSTIIQSILIVCVIAGMLLYILKKKKNRDPIVDRVEVAYWMSVIGALSWLVLMPGHAYVHPHINAIIFYLPLLLICYIIFGLWVEYYWKFRKNKHET